MSLDPAPRHSPGGCVRPRAQTGEAGAGARAREPGLEEGAAVGTAQRRGGRAQRRGGRAGGRRGLGTALHAARPLPPRPRPGTPPPVRGHSFDPLGSERAPTPPPPPAPTTSARGGHFLENAFSVNCAPSLLNTLRWTGRPLRPRRGSDFQNGNRPKKLLRILPKSNVNNVK